MGGAKGLARPIRGLNSNMAWGSPPALAASANPS